MKTWGSVPNDLPALDAMRHCIANGILTADNKIQAACVTFGPDGVGYSGYRRVSIKEILERKAIVAFFEGFSVIWTDVLHDPMAPGRVRKIEEYDETVRSMAYRKFVWWRQFSGTRNEVTAFTSHSP